jgi:hypothetical protein
MDYISRINIVLENDPQFAFELIDFFENNPEFEIVKHLIPLTKLPQELMELQYAPKNVLERIIEYICIAGVQTAYGIDQYKKLLSLYAQDIPSNSINPL